MIALKRLVGAGILIFLFTLSLFLIRTQSSSVADYPRMVSLQGLQEKIIEVPTGATGSEIAEILFDAGVIKSSQAFLALLSQMLAHKKLHQVHIDSQLRFQHSKP